MCVLWHDARELAEPEPELEPELEPEPEPGGGWWKRLLLLEGISSTVA